MENKDLSYLKKHYGEDFAHLCRELFPTILEKEGRLSDIISSKFAPTKSLYSVCSKNKNLFKDYIYNFADIEQSEEQPATKTPTELLDEAGYILYPECQTEEDIQSFKKYWASGEELCTFRGGRLDSCRVWFAVKKNVDEIKRKNFRHPSRQDEYGTSAISIQFSRGKQSTLSIKNRYNHTVFNPDSTFSNNLDNIIPGLTQSFKDTYNINLVKGGNLSFMYCLDSNDFRMGADGKYYKTNIENFDICFCENNVVLVLGRVEKIDKSRYILAENYLIDLQQNTIKCGVDFVFVEFTEDSFTRSIGKIKKISLQKGKNDQKTLIFTLEEGENVELTLNKSNQIIGYSNPNVQEIGNQFLAKEEKLENLYLPNLKKVGVNFLFSNKELRNLDLPNLESVDEHFLFSNQKLESINLPKLEYAAKNFLLNGGNLTELTLPNLKVADEFFFCLNENIKKLSMPNLERAGKGFLKSNKKISELDLPKLEVADDWFLYGNEELKKLSLPNLRIVGSECLKVNTCLSSLSLPKLQDAGGGFLYGNRSLKQLSLPSLENAGWWFLKENNECRYLSLPKLKKIEPMFMEKNNSILRFYIPNYKSIKDSDFFKRNKDKLVKTLNTDQDMEK